jgi:hypothetical protein
MFWEDEAAYRLAKRWLLIEVDWEIGHDGRVRALRPRPVSWTDAEVALLWEVFGHDPFPGPRDPEHVKRVVSSRRVEQIMAVRIPKAVWTEVDGEEEYWRELIGDEPPDEDEA